MHVAIEHTHKSYAAGRVNVVQDPFSDSLYNTIDAIDYTWIEKKVGKCQDLKYWLSWGHCA